MLPCISIIVPVYNTSRYLDRCIESLLCQSYKNLEIIFVDDGSTDDSGIILDKWKEKDSRIKVYHKENGGVASARNLGLEKSQGKYIGWVDSDDWVEKNYFNNLMDKIINYDVEIVVSGKKAKTERMIEKDDIIKEFLMDNLSRELWRTVASRELFYNKKFEKYSIGEDTYMLCQIFEEAHSLCLIPGNGYHYEIREDSAVHNVSINKYNDWIDVYLLMKTSVKPYLSYRMIIEMGVIYGHIRNSTRKVKKTLLKKMRKIYIDSLFNLNIRFLSVNRIKIIVATGKNMLIG